MDVSLSIVISNCPCYTSPWSRRAKDPGFNGQSSGRTHLNHVGIEVKHRYSATSFNLNGSSKSLVFSSSATKGIVTSPTNVMAVEDDQHLNNASAGPLLHNGKDDTLPKIDKSGRFCNPRAARELAVSIIYAACLEGSDPVRLLDRRLNAPREPGYEFDKGSLLSYNHMSFSGPPTVTDTYEEADELLRQLDAETRIEAEVLSAPPKLVYSKLVLHLTRKLLVAVQEKWDDHVAVIDKVAPVSWKNEPAGRILEFSILHLAMSEISVIGTQPPIVINEAVDLAKRFCDGAAPRVLNGCLRTFMRGLKDRKTGVLRAGQKVLL